MSSQEIETTITQFLESVRSVAEQLQVFRLDVENREEQIKRIVQDLQTLLTQIEWENAENDSQFQEMLAETIRLYRGKVDEWLKLVLQHIEGKEFMNQFEKSILLVVFGNVNTGKSSLGNFIAGVPESLRSVYPEVPPFYVYEFSQAADTAHQPKLLAEGKFQEGAVETTSSIQYFTLQNGVTWVDTPGIHSINSFNEDLAKKYVDFSDLVLFLVPSSSPGKADEIDELERLIKKQKPLLVTITKSDRTYEDELDGEIITVLEPKSPADRQAQETYIADVLKQKGIDRFIKDTRFVSISPNIAKKALAEADHDLFWQSGIPAFYEQIGSVLTRDAVELKTNRPRQQINSTIDELRHGFALNQQSVSGIGEMMEAFRAILQSIADTRQRMAQLTEPIIKDVRNKSSLMMDIELRKLAFQFDEGKAIGSSEISNLVASVVVSALQDELPRKVGKVLEQFQLDQMQQLHVKLDVKLEAQYENIAYQDYLVKEGYRDPQGVIEHIGSWFGKKYKTTRIKTEEKQMTVKVGNNVQEIVAVVNQRLDEIIRERVEQTMQELNQKYLSQSETMVKHLLDKLASVDQQLTTLAF
ncbi:dynamin family protein [Brevibacillus fulvus]|uniref:F0F1-type ATP synthase membrane subunit b/b n=1 Tax=Brevibacillus fulvus TaxID=1125967 RepID=A0A938XRU6_9BACL|nr:dynamin family protein [Brevibacillus fulvus]MBM7589133.1 F0F1-type ATP synthase membrane subunit b/b' [Brevibacillus fulvus]